MLKKSIRKVFGLVALYAVFIVGIFVMQFKSDSIIRKNIRAMRVTLSETESESGQTSLKNSFQLSFNGLLFSADENNPITYTREDSTEVPVRLLSLDEGESLSYALNFSDGVRLTFSLSEDSDAASLWIAAEMPPNASAVNARFSPYSGFSVKH